MINRILLSLLCSVITLGLSAKSMSYDDVKDIVRKVNNYWQENNKPEKTFFWHQAAYHTGNIEAYHLTGDKSFLEYSKAWATHNNWSGSTGNDKSKWVYNYGETPDHVLFGDNQICFQVYADLYQIYGQDKMVQRAKEVMEYQLSTPKNDYIWWSDGLYMVMPVMTKMYKITNNIKYLDKLYDYFKYADNIMFDKEENLYYRDKKYVYPKHKSINGKKDFWARGDGWVLAAFAKVLQDLPSDFTHRDFFIERFQQMSKAVIAIQQKDGYWSRSMMDEAHAPGPETSGTAFFMYGLMWGVNNGYLSKDIYMPAIEKAWEYLSKTALQKKGRVGYIQPIGEKAIPGQVVDANSSYDFGVGAFLLAACEYARYLEVPNQVDRTYWSEQAYKMAMPILSEMSQGTLRKNMQIEVGPDWKNRDTNLVYMEAFGRLMSGIAPWLALPDDDTKEGVQRKQLREWALKSYANAVDPENPDYLLWFGPSQVLVDAAYIAESFLRAYDTLWMPLDNLTKERYIKLFQGLRQVDPPYTNWILFSSVIETFLMKSNAQFDRYRTSMALRKVDEWYVGDGWYADGQGQFAFDYYSSFVFHPMYVEVASEMRYAKGWTNINYNSYYNKAFSRAQRFSMVLERMISPEGTFPLIGRSITYRLGAMQALAFMAWYDRLPATMSRAQVRCALTAVMENFFTKTNIYNEGGYLTLGFTGKQLELVNHYTNNGSLYMCSLAFMPLGLPASHPFWSDAPQDWTNKKGWSGESIPIDYHH